MILIPLDVTQQGEELQNSIKNYLNIYNTQLSEVNKMETLENEEQDIMEKVAQNEQRLDSLTIPLPDDKELNKKFFSCVINLMEENVKSNYAEVGIINNLYHYVCEQFEKPAQFIPFKNFDNIIRLMNSFTYTSPTQWENASFIADYSIQMKEMYNDIVITRSYYDDAHKILLDRAKQINPNLKIG